MTLFVNLKDIIGFALLVLAGGVIALVMLRQWLKQAQCKHDRYHETSACDAVCSNCGKNLGFIGNLR